MNTSNMQSIAIWLNWLYWTQGLWVKCSKARVWPPYLHTRQIGATKQFCWSQQFAWESSWPDWHLIDFSAASAQTSLLPITFLWGTETKFGLRRAHCMLEANRDGSHLQVGCLGTFPTAFVPHKHMPASVTLVISIATLQQLFSKEMLHLKH